MTKENKEEYLTMDQTMAQLAIIKQRLETYPLANHEVVCLKDCMLLLIRTFAGEKIPELQLAHVGGGTLSGSNQNENSEYIGGEMRRGGVEIAPGVMQYPAAPDAATMDVQESLGELNESLQATKAPLPEMPTPMPGSLMAMARANEEADSRRGDVETSATERQAASEMQRQSEQAPDGIPSPSDTRVEITS